MIRNDNNIIIAFIASVIDAGNSPETNIFLNSNESYFKETGLKVSSIIRTDKLATIDKKIILGELGYLNSQLLSLVNEKLRIVLDIN
ncbi:MAG TPA: type II toxin-antitoxin system PemK/MazF family toxin [Ignavibacteria bacterium]|nr:type II toxin-antitoxin system PemK/MazF family toxin [Ignavibacteria bacterium]